MSNAAGANSLLRAAASSIASGSPSRRVQISATSGAVTSVTAKSGCTSRARSTNNATAAYAVSGGGVPDTPARTAAPLAGPVPAAAGSMTVAACGCGGSASGATRTSFSPRSFSAARLVARIFTPGAAASSAARSGAAASRCSQLSSSSSACRARRYGLQALQHRAPAALAHAQRLRDRHDHQLRIRRAGPD